ncbi:MAG: 30S ribosomal protein S18 [Patescibacteria group bacterium]|nr:30S ribosomal protein S18 [Patescibacteria group bacterium]
MKKDKKGKSVSRPKRKSLPKKCMFCSENKEPHFSETEILRRFVTERGKIVPRSRSGVCAKHQKTLGLSIKYARHLALLPFLER